MNRRHFVTLCTSALALATANPRALARPRGALHRYARARLVDSKGQPIHARKLAVDRCYVFFYPYAGTPCYLIRLGVLTQGETLAMSDGTPYDWQGGVGPDGTVVAFSAICSHLMTHPTRKISFINYHADADELSGRQNVISCCAHGSVFDPARGAKVVSGPATQPLTAIALEHEKASDELFAVGTYGGETYRDFFRAFKRDLREEFGRRGATREIHDDTVVRPIEDYTKQAIRC
ncbi:MAG: Rieske 2Fe-2S domain-containing protein [Gammaproteobacteria bacterium]